MTLLSYICYFGLVASGISVSAKEMQVDAAKSQSPYRSGKKHQEIMDMKMKSWETARARGGFRQDSHPKLTFTDHGELGSPQAGVSLSWGWTSANGREFVAIGQYEGTTFVEINTRTGHITYLGRLPAYSFPSEWREIRGDKDYMIIGSEALSHGIKIFHMKKLLELDAKSIPKVFDSRYNLTSHFEALLPLGRAHNVVVNEELGYTVAVGAMPREDPVCPAGLNFIGLDNPSDPESLGCANGDGYVYDAQCIVYRGPDTRYYGTDLCYAYNEDSLTIYNVTDKANTTNIISKISYEGATYTRQSWGADEMNQEYLLLDDEYGEEKAAGLASDGLPVTYIWDISNLEAPRQSHFKANIRGIDHNQYVHESFTYQSNYGAGLRVVDVFTIPTDTTGNSVCEVGFFDIYPEVDNLPNGGKPGFTRTWSNYPYFKSGFTFVNTIERGAYTIKLQQRQCPTTGFRNGLLMVINVALSGQ